MDDPRPQPSAPLNSVNIKSLIPFSLELSPPNYGKWRELFSVLLRRFNLTKHVDGSGSSAGDPDWAPNDSTVVSWIYGSVSDEVLGYILNPGASAHTLWTNTEGLFHDNKQARIIAMEAEFRTTMQGDQPVMAYCQRMKNIADSLGDLGHTITDATLVLTILQGLNENFAMIRKIITSTDVLPSFLQTRSKLVLDEASHSKSSTPSVFYSASSGSFGSSNTSSARSNHSRGYGKGRNKSGGKGGKGGGFGGQGSGALSTYAGTPSTMPPTVFNPWTGTFQLWTGPVSAPLGGTLSNPMPRQNAPGILGRAPPQAHFVSTPSPPMWDQQSLVHALNAMTLQQPDSTNWYVDSGASNHLTSDAGNLLSSQPSSHSQHVVVGDGTRLPITGSGHLSLPTHSSHLHLKNVLISPRIIQNLISVRQFTTDNLCSIEFDPFGLSVKDLRTRTEIIRCNSSGPLYSIRLPSPLHALAASVKTEDLWHRRLGHLGHHGMSHLISSSSIPCNKRTHHDSSLCHACQLGRHVRLPFTTSTSRTNKPFELIHCDLWTSPIPSVSGYKYYLVALDDLTHYVWTFPLRYKSDTFPTLKNFFAFVSTQFHTTIQNLQCDNGREFDHATARNFLQAHGIHLRLSCPYTSQQNGKAERILRSLNNIVRSLLFQASMPAPYWAEALSTATHLINLHPTKTLSNRTPHHALFGQNPSYHHLRVFGCTCYPNLSSTAPNKLSPRSTACVFLGYPTHHKGYRCLDLTTNRLIISRHVVFDEASFPFAKTSCPPSSTYSFLDVPPSVEALLPCSSPSLPAGPPPGSAPAPSTSAAPPSPTVVAPTPPAPPRSAPASPTVALGLPSSRAATTSPPVVQVTPASPRAAPPPVVPVPLMPPSTPIEVAPTQSAVTSSTTTARVVPVQSTVNAHGMATRGKHGIRVLPREILDLAVTTISPLPKTYKGALNDPHWHSAMLEEFQALCSNNTWDLVPRPPDANVVSGKWVFRHKLNPDGSLARYKARWVLRGFSQQPGIDFEETFSPVVKPATIRLVLSLALSKDWPIHQLDVKNAFLHGTLTETVFCQQPSGFVDADKPHHVCRLNKSLYGLKQAPRAWFSRFTTFITSLGFTSSKSDPSLFIYHKGSATAYLLLYVDDIILTASTTVFLNRIIHSLRQEFSMTDLGDLHYFLGVTARRTQGGLFLSQEQYAHDIINRANMTSCNPCSTPIDTRSKLPASVGPPVSNPTLYRSLAGALQYLTFTRPDISYAVQQVCLHMHDPREPHFNLIKRILRYVQGTADFGLHLTRSSCDSLVAYSDADWAGCPDTRKSTSGYCVFLGDNLLSWSSKRQPTVSRSSAEAEYRGVANAVAETCWLRQLMAELHCPLKTATIVYCDNISSVYLSSNPVQHQRTKHVEIDLHFVRERVALGDVRVLHVPSSSQYADIFTKGLPSTLFLDFRSSLNICRAPS